MGPKLPLGQYDMSSMTISAMIPKLDEHEWTFTTHNRKVVSFQGRHPRGNTIVITRRKKSPKPAKAKDHDQVPGYVALQKYGNDQTASPLDGTAATHDTDLSVPPPQAPTLDLDTSSIVSPPESESKTVDGAVISEIGPVRHERNRKIWVSSCSCDRQ